MSLAERAPSPDSGETLDLVEDMLHESRQEQKKYVKRWNRYYRVFRNRAWSESRSSHLPSPQSPQFFPTMHTLTSYMTDQYPVIYTSPEIDPSDFKQPPPPEIVEARQQDMEKYLNSWWVFSGAHRQSQMALMDAMLYGGGMFKTGLDITKRGGLGEPTMHRVDPYNILPDPSASCLEDSRYLLEVKRVPLYEIIQRFPERGHLVEPDEPGRDESTRPRDASRGSAYDVIGQSGLRATGVTGEFPGSPTSGIPPLWGRSPGSRKQDYTETVQLIEAWVRGEDTIQVPVIEDGERQETIDVTVPYWEFIAVANGVVLTPETTNPFDHAQLPYVRLPHVEIGEFWEMSLSEQLLPAQVALNRLLAATQINAELTGNPIFIEPESSGISRTKILNRPGGRIRVNTGATQFVRWLDPPQMSRDVLQLISYWQDVIDRTSGITAVARGSTLRRREAAASVDSVQEASFTRIRAVLRNYEEALRQCLEQVASNAVQFSVEPHGVPVIGPKGSQDVLQLGHKHFYIPQVEEQDGEMTLTDDVPLKFRVWVQAGSSLPLSRSARASEALTLYEGGVIDRKEVLSAFNWPNAEAVLARVEQQQQQALMQEAMERSS